MWFAQNEFAQGVLPQLYVTRWGGGGCWHSITYIHTHKIAVSIETWLHSRATPGPLLVEFEWMLSFITCNHWGETRESVHSSPIKWFYSYYSRLLSTLCNTLHSFPSPGLYLHSPAGGNKSYKALILIRLFFLLGCGHIQVHHVHSSSCYGRRMQLCVFLSDCIFTMLCHKVHLSNDSETEAAMDGKKELGLCKYIWLDIQK